jgi:hypothetical protein
MTRPRAVFGSAPPLTHARYKFRGTSVLLPDGRVLVAGGAPVPEIYDPVSGMFSAIDGTLGRAPLFATASLVASGDVLLVGGYSLTGPASDAAWLIAP